MLAMTDTPPVEEPVEGPTEEPATDEPFTGEVADPDPAPEREPTEPEDETTEVVLESTEPTRKPLRTDLVTRTITTKATEGILREIRGFPTDAPDWIPAELRPVLGAIWKQIVTEVNKLPEFVDETQLVLGDRVIVYLIDTAEPAGSGRFFGMLDGIMAVLLDDGSMGKFTVDSFALGRP